VALLSETHLKPHERFSIPNYYFYRTDRHPGRKGGTAVAVRKGIPHNHVAVYKSPGRAWSDADITELLRFRRKSILAGDLNAKHSF
jgi:hypothetical protein